MKRVANDASNLERAGASAAATLLDFGGFHPCVVHARASRHYDQGSFYLAGALAPAIVYTDVRDPEEIPFDDPTLFAKDMQAVFDDPNSFADIIVVAEVLQTVMALTIVAAAVAPKRPLPPGWFQWSLTGQVTHPLEEANGAAPRGDDKPPGAPGTVSGALGSGGGAAVDQRKRRAAAAAQKQRSENWLGEAGNAALLVWGLVLLITALSYATGLRGDTVGTASNSVIEKAFAAGPDGAASLLFTTVIMAPVLEETVFRGFLLPSLTRWMSVPWALGVSTSVFALVHEHNTGDTIQLLAVGAMAGVAYCRTRNLAASMLVHATFNLGVLALFSIWTN